MAKLGFLGLGIMGYPMARNLLRARPPGEARAAWLPAVYARRDLGKRFQPRGLGDRLAVLRAAFTGRL